MYDFVNKSIAILQITDLHIMASAGDKLMGIDTEYYFKRVLNQAFNTYQSFDLVLLTGDLAQEPCQASYSRLNGYLQQLGVPCICLPGNHDDFLIMEQVLNQGSVSCQKQALLGNWQIICLNSQIPDSADGILAPQELEFLENCLITHPEHFALIALHHHCLPTMSFWMDNMMIKNSSRFLHVAGLYPQVKIITCGHIHQILDEQYGNIKVFGSPSTCFQFTPLSTNFSLDTTAPGYRIISLNPDGSSTSKVIRLPIELTEIELNGHY